MFERAQDGDPKAAEELLPLVYAELRKLAAHKMANERAGHTLQPTALVHEAAVARTALDLCPGLVAKGYRSDAATVNSRPSLKKFGGLAPCSTRY